MDTLTAHLEGSGRTRHRPDRPRPDERGGRSPWPPAVLALVVLAFYPLVSLVLLPESPRSFAARSVTLVLIGAAVAAGLAIARRAPGWFRGTARLAAGFAATAVTGGDTGHIQALSTHPDEYRTRVLSVFDGALLAR